MVVEEFVYLGGDKLLAVMNEQDPYLSLDGLDFLQRGFAQGALLKP